MTRSKKLTRTIHPLQDRDLARIVGGADLESAGEDLKSMIKAAGSVFVFLAGGNDGNNS